MPQKNVFRRTVRAHHVGWAVGLRILFMVWLSLGGGLCWGIHGDFTALCCRAARLRDHATEGPPQALSLNLHVEFRGPGGSFLVGPGVWS